MKQLKLVIAALFLVSPLAANADLINGSLEGPTGAGVVPTGWTLKAFSPDTTSTATEECCGFFVNPGDSPDGGTWVGIARDGTITEVFGQTVSDFVIGTTYDLSWYVTNTGCCGGSWAAPAAVQFVLDGTTVFTGEQRATDGLWYLESFSFIATATSHTLDFRLDSGPQAYMGIDGISLSAATTTVPEPGTLALLGLGLAGMGISRRKKKA